MLLVKLNMRSDFFKEIEFEVDGAEINDEQIKYSIPYDFNGKNDFIDFYKIYNGIDFPDGAFIKRSKFYVVSDDEYDELEVECFYEMPNSLVEIWEATKEHSLHAKLFAEQHIPFARDAAGNDFWIEIDTGMIKYVSWEDDFP